MCPIVSIVNSSASSGASNAIANQKNSAVPINGAAFKFGFSYQFPVLCFVEILKYL